MSLIYYASPAHVDQLFRAWVGEFGSRTVTTTSNTAASASAEAGLSKLLAAIADLRGKGGVEVGRTRGETLEVEQNVHARAALLLDVLQKKLPTIHEHPDGLCWYSLPTRVATRKVDDQAVVEVGFESEELAFSGVTTAEHWLSASLRNNVLMAAARSPTRAVHTFGILLPLHALSSGGQTTLQVQFIILASPDTWA